MPDSRPLTAEDQQRLDAEFGRFREEFDCWRGMSDWDILEFARYEGVRPPVVDELGPLVLGEKCVEQHGARWCMLMKGDDWPFAIAHDELIEPVDLSNFNRKRIERKLSQKWQRLLDPRHPAR